MPSPEFSPVEALRETAQVRTFQKRVFQAFAEGAPFRVLLDRIYDPALPRMTRQLWEEDGLDSEQADIFLHMMVEIFTHHSPAEMFFFYVHADPRKLAQAIDNFGFWPMQIRFLELVDRNNFALLHCRCKDAVEEFQLLCEELGLIYCLNQHHGEDHEHEDPTKESKSVLAGIHRSLEPIQKRVGFLRREQQFAELKKQEWERLRDVGKVSAPFLTWYEGETKGTEFEVKGKENANERQ